MTLLARRPRLAAATLAALALALGACESEPRRDGDPSRRSVLATELDKICRAVDLAGAGALPEGDRMVQVAMWLDQNIKSDEGLTFLRSWAKLGNDKAARLKMLEDATRANGLSDCPLVAYWK